ncbi:NAD-dependent epimerase/dehydratase family protein [Ruegeria marina]|uniref:CDP-glucose 4,6-dehydratase n=1 Tax=Ruegeria marina TaxID=639004 RepID=A0A1G6VM35_9RHOB|nr:NAD(P)-dependent oxidoreductase [Ruegeria marina]SDD53906.1 CDP-glucose 4,6-dehydratase [Ruegeria marina]
MTVLVTGASGFVGGWLVRRLADAGLRVVAQMRRPASEHFRQLGLADRPDVSTLIDASMPKVLRETRPDVMFHLGGLSQVVELLAAPETAYEGNARAGWQLLEAMRQMEDPPRTVVASSDAIYGETGDIAATEEDLPAALGPYEVSKLMLDYAARSYGQMFSLPVVVARLGNVYGPGDANGARIVPSVIRAVREGRAPQLRGGGRAVRSLLHVDDCVDALLMLATHAGDPAIRGQAFNVSGGPPMTTLEIARKTLDAFGKEKVVPEIIDGAPGETSVKYSSSEKLRLALGWSPKVPFEDGIRTVVDSYQDGTA